MVGHDDSISTGFACGNSIGLVENSLDHQRSLPETTDQPEMIPVKVPAIGIIAQHVRRDNRRPAPGVVILEVRHAMADQSAQQGPEKPTWMRHPVPSQTQAGPERRRKSRPDVVLAVARDLDRKSTRLNS